MKSFILFATSILLLSSCDGPWSMSPAEYTPPDPQLNLSLFVVGGRDFDTLWLERTQPLELKYDSTRVFVQSADIQVVSADDGTVLVKYSPVPGSAVAWVPQSQVKAVAGKKYRLNAHVVWNADKNWPSGVSTKTTDLVAEAKVPESWSVDKTALVPIENLIPALAAGADVTDSLTLLAPLEAEHPGTLAKWSMTSAMLDSLRSDKPVFRTMHSGDTIWYISDNEHVVTNPDGKQVKRAYRQILLRQHPSTDFGGVFAVERWDVNRAYVLDPLTKEARRTFGMGDIKQDDSASFYQPGNTRYGYGPYPAYLPDLFGWPNIYPFSNLTLSYTGPNMLYIYSVQEDYVIYQSQRAQQAQGSNTAPPFTNVKGGGGYFAAALVDSFLFNLSVSGTDTFTVQSLRGSACRSAWIDAMKNKTAFDSLVTCKGVEFHDTAGLRKALSK